MTNKHRPIHDYVDSIGAEWDLNDPETYVKNFTPEQLGLDARGLYSEILRQIGFSLFYMICAHPSRPWKNSEQYYRIVEFGKHFAVEVREPDRWDNIPWLRKQLFLIIDENENQC